MTRNIVSPMPTDASLSFPPQRPAQQVNQTLVTFEARILNFPGP